jgi:branched-chain amino acid transport system ATP-binding protein
MSTLLRLASVEAGYRDLVAVRDVSLEVRAGEVVALIGSNGAGKTTTLRAISGLLPVRRGRVEFDGDRIDGRPSSAIVGRGIAHVPEGRQLFPTLTVRENLELGSRDRRARASALEDVFALFPRLRERQRQLAGTLSGGEQQMCAIGRGLMANPRLLLLDEPSLGLAPVMVKLIFETLAAINARGTTILLVEQNVNLALQTAGRAYVLQGGRVAAEGSSDALRSDPLVQRAYLGRDAAAGLGAA